VVEEVVEEVIPVVESKKEEHLEKDTSVTIEAEEETKTAP
jgi:hypothetical protein